MFGLRKRKLLSVVDFFNWIMPLLSIMGVTSSILDVRTSPAEFGRWSQLTGSFCPTRPLKSLSEDTTRAYFPSQIDDGPKRCSPKRWLNNIKYTETSTNSGVYCYLIVESSEIWVNLSWASPWYFLIMEWKKQLLSGATMLNKSQQLFFSIVFVGLPHPL